VAAMACALFLAKLPNFLATTATKNSVDLGNVIWLLL